MRLAGLQTRTGICALPPAKKEAPGAEAGAFFQCGV